MQEQISKAISGLEKGRGKKLSELQEFCSQKKSQTIAYQRN